MEKLAYLCDEDDIRNDTVGFIQVRLVGPRGKKKPGRKPPKKKDGDKNLRYASCSPETQKGLRASRAQEWQKWNSFNAGLVLTRKELDELTDEGVKVHPMQWIETDKNAHKRRDGKHVEALLKSRLVGCGNSKILMVFAQIRQPEMWTLTT